MKIYDKKDYSISLSGHNPASGWTKGKKKSLETRKKMSQTHRAKRAQGWMKNFVFTKEHRKNLSIANRLLLEQGRDWKRVRYIYHTDHGLMRMKDAMKFYSVCPQTVQNRCAKQGYGSTVRWKKWYRIPFQNTPGQVKQLQQAYRRCFGRDLPYINTQKNRV